MSPGWGSGTSSSSELVSSFPFGSLSSYSSMVQPNVPHLCTPWGLQYNQQRSSHPPSLEMTFFRSAKKTTRNKNKRFLCDTVVNTFGGYIKIFYLGKQANERKTKSGRFPWWAQPTWARQASQARPGVLCPPRLPS